MYDISLGIVIVLITAFGYASNALNWRYLNYGITRFLYYIGAFVHETSHAILCVLTGAKIERFTVFSYQPCVVHTRSRLPLVGEFLISSAPIAGGLAFFFLVNRYLLGNYFALPQLPGTIDWQSSFALPLAFLLQINLREWQSWVMIVLSVNAGAMLGPSTQDLKNVWPMLIVFFFVRSPLLAGLGLAALSLIFVNIIIQAAAIVLLKVLKFGIVSQ